MNVKRVVVSVTAVGVTVLVCVVVLVAAHAYASGATVAAIDPETLEHLEDLFAGSGATGFRVVPGAAVEAGGDPGADTGADDEGPAPAYHAYAGENRVGTAARGVGEGYRSPIRVLVAVDADGVILGVSVTAQNETAGLGDVVTEPDFLERFSGKSGADPLTIGQDIDNVSGATWSAEGVAAAVRQALQVAADHATTGRDNS